MANPSLPSATTDPAATAWRWRAENAAAAAARGAAARKAAGAARRRGALGGAVGLLVAAGIAFGLHRPALGAGAGLVAAAVAAVALASPLGLYPRLERAFDLLAHGVGSAVTWVLMALLYYLLFLPAGLLLRAAGKLAVTRRADPRLASYWSPAGEREPGPGPYRKQF
jgi:hypothetical protein